MKILIEESVLRQALCCIEGWINACGPTPDAGDLVASEALRSALDAAEGVEPDYFGLTEDNTWMSCTKRIYDALKPEARMACYPAPHSNPQDEAERLDVNVRPTAWADLAVGTGGFLTTDEALSNGLTPLFDKASLDATFEDGRMAEREINRPRTGTGD